MLSVLAVAPLVFWIAALLFTLALAARLSFRPLVAIPLLVTRLTRRAGPRANVQWLGAATQPEPR